MTPSLLAHNVLEVVEVQKEDLSYQQHYFAKHIDSTLRMKVPQALDGIKTFGKSEMKVYEGLGCTGCEDLLSSILNRKVCGKELKRQAIVGSHQVFEPPLA